MRTAIFPGGTLGILGGGQLGRMLCLEARRMGYRTVVWSGTEVAEPVEAVADVLLAAGFEDQRALERFVGEVDVATVEFENIPLDVLERVGGEVPLRPGALAVGICQHREREKTFLKEKGIACTPVPAGLLGRGVDSGFG